MYQVEYSAFLSINIRCISMYLLLIFHKLFNVLEFSVSQGSVEFFCYIS